MAIYSYDMHKLFQYKNINRKFTAT